VLELGQSEFMREEVVLLGGLLFPRLQLASSGSRYGLGLLNVVVVPRGTQMRRT
jgi:hypothetical protein